MMGSTAPPTGEATAMTGAVIGVREQQVSQGAAAALAAAGIDANYVEGGITTCTMACRPVAASVPRRASG
jgi:hypothetical protein